MDRLNTAIVFFVLLPLVYMIKLSLTAAERDQQFYGKEIITDRIYDGETESKQYLRDGQDEGSFKMRTSRAVIHQMILLQVREDDQLFNYTVDHEEERDGEEVHETEEEEEEKIPEDNCTHPRQHPMYNDSCDFVHAECGGKSELIDYLAFVLCDLPKAQVSTDLKYCCVAYFFVVVSLLLY